MIGFLADFLISIIPTFIVSRLFLWFTKRWTNSLVRLIALHIASLGLCVLAGIAVLSSSDTYRPVTAFALFAPGQLAWLLVDAFRLVRRRRERGE
jgi:hypothetical protein